MTPREIQTYMIKNGAPSDEVFCNISDSLVSFDIREVPTSSYDSLHVVMVDKYNATIASPL